MSTGAIRIGIEELRSLAFGSIGAGYAGIGTTFDNPARMLFLQNLTDAILLFSDDGVTDKIILPAGGYMMVDGTANKTKDQGLFFTEGSRLYVKQSGVPSSGSVYLTLFYGDNGY